MPLALLIGAVLVAGIVFAVVRQPEREDWAEPTPTAPRPETPTAPPDEETPPPDEDAVAMLAAEEPPRRPLAETGGPVVPFLGMGAALVALSAALWRFSRPRAD